MAENSTIIVQVRGGVVQDVQFPQGCGTAVSVHDYDIDGSDQAGLDRDDEGHAFCNARWDPPETQAPSDASDHERTTDQACRTRGMGSSQAPIIIPAFAPTGIAEIDELPANAIRHMLAKIYHWMYWNPNTMQWDLDRDISGADTVQLLCELLPYPP